jgi:hypothetical protein
MAFHPEYLPAKYLFLSRWIYLKLLYHKGVMCYTDVRINRKFVDFVELFLIELD